jgi:hypothetical protein
MASSLVLNVYKLCFVSYKISNELDIIVSASFKPNDTKRYLKMYYYCRSLSRKFQWQWQVFGQVVRALALLLLFFLSPKEPRQVQVVDIYVKVRRQSAGQFHQHFWCQSRVAFVFGKIVPKYGVRHKLCSLRHVAKFQNIKCWWNITASFAPFTLCCCLCTLQKMVGDIDFWYKVISIRI